MKFSLPMFDYTFTSYDTYYNTFANFFLLIPSGCHPYRRSRFPTTPIKPCRDFGEGIFNSYHQGIRARNPTPQGTIGAPVLFHNIGAPIKKILIRRLG
jgi:hypothetical protein